MADHDQLERLILARLDAKDSEGAVTEAIRGYGPQLLGYLSAVVRDEELAREVFSVVCEDMWRGLPTFRRDGSFRGWSYKLAYHAAMRTLREPYRRRMRRLASELISAIADQVKSTTAVHLKTEKKDHLTAVREKLTPEEQTLLVLRVDRNLPWREVATVLSGDGSDVDEAAARKRFERLKEKLKKLLAARTPSPE